MVVRRDERITRLALASANRAGRLKTGDDAPQFVETLKLDAIDPDPNQPRRHFDQQQLQELADSLTLNGQLQPIVVVKAGDRYKLHVGERRWRAARLAGLTTIRALVRGSTLAARDALVAQLAENEQRANLTVTELVEAVRQLATLGMKSVEIARALGKSPTRISELQALTSAPAELTAIADDIGLNLSYQLLRQWRSHPAEALDFIAQIPVEHIGRFTIGTIGQPPPDDLTEHAAKHSPDKVSLPEHTAAEVNDGEAAAVRRRPSGDSGKIDIRDRQPPLRDLGDPSPTPNSSDEGPPWPSRPVGVIVRHPDVGTARLVFDPTTAHGQLALALGDGAIVFVAAEEVRIVRCLPAPVDAS